jgi:hypothetical protein
MIKDDHTLIRSRLDSNISARHVCHGSLPKRLVVCNPVRLLQDLSGRGAVGRVRSSYWQSDRSIYFATMSSNVIKLPELVGEGGESRNRGVQLLWPLELPANAWRVLPVNTWKVMVDG